MKNFRLIAAILLGLPLGAAALEVPSDGTPIELLMDGAPAGQVTFLTNIYVDVPDGAQQMRIFLQGEEGPGRDVDVLVRYGSDFDLSGVSSLGDLFDQAHFYSAGADQFEHVTITRASNPALTAGRWYLMPVNFHSLSTMVTLSATASSGTALDAPELGALYNSEEESKQTGFFDPAPFSSAHNPAETLGEARRLAFERALEIASLELKDAGVTSPVPVLVGARFEDLGDFEDDRITLAQAGPRGFASNFPGALRRDTVYALPQVAKQAGTDACRLFSNIDCGDPDLLAVFNANEETGWSYALESVSSSSDFISVAMHEVMHGLGFLSLFAVEDDEEGEFRAGDWLAPFPDAYSRNLVHLAGGVKTPLSELDGAGRMAAATSVSGLRWAGINVAESPGNPFTAIDQYFRMYAPATIRPGSSVSHVASASPVPASELMRPTTSIFSPRNIGHTGAFMLDLGWGGQALGSAGQPIHFGMSGLWYNQATSGQGFLFDVAATQDPPQLAAFWFTFADEAGGPDGQRWYTAQGDYNEGDSSIDLTVYMTTGGEFDRRPPAPETTPVGEMTIAFQSCNEATMSYNFNLDDDPAKRAQGAVPLSRLSPDIACAADMEVPGPPAAPITPPRPFRLNYGLNGVWRERATSGQGLLFDVVEAQDPPQLVALWFTYAEQAGGAEGQRWFIAQGDFEEGDRSVRLDVRMSTGGEFDTRPPVPELTTVGEAVLEFGTGIASCREGTLSYEISLDGDAGQTRSGEIALERVTADILCESFFDR